MSRAYQVLSRDPIEGTQVANVRIAVGPHKVLTLTVPRAILDTPNEGAMIELLLSKMTETDDTLRAGGE